MTLSDYDDLIKPQLHAIETCARAAARHARAMVERPNFETLAEQELADALRIINNVRARVIQAQQIMKHKPVEA